MQAHAAAQRIPLDLWLPRLSTNSRANPPSLWGLLQLSLGLVRRVGRTTEFLFVADVKCPTQPPPAVFCIDCHHNSGVARQYRKLDMWRSIPEQHRPPQRPWKAELGKQMLISTCCVQETPLQPPVSDNLFLQQYGDTFVNIEELNMLVATA